MDKKTFDEFRRVVYEKSGITLHEGKEALVAARTGKRMRALGIENHRQYLDYILHDRTGSEVIQLLDVISTNVTHFFRESTHFDFLGQQLGVLISSGQNKIRIWCAASSSGEEPYSIAMTFLENCNGFRGDMRILATDISTKVLTTAISGFYSKEKTKDIPPLLKDRYFEPAKVDNTDGYLVRKSVRDMITFSRLNLSAPPFPMHGPFDFIFCRNVMIYFDNAVRKRLLAEIYRLLKPGGFLIVGHAESLTGIQTHLRNVKPSVYIKGK